jgi:hypothetical protein
MEVVEIRAAYGLDLIDVLTGGPITGASRVEAVDDPEARSYLAASRWVFERLRAGAVSLKIEADLYTPKTILTGAGSFPLVPPPANPGVVASVPLSPRTGYPFAPNLTRVFGLVRYRPTGSPVAPLAVGASVTVRGRYQRTTAPPTPVTGPPLSTLTADDGQYTMWFLPTDFAGADYERLPFRCRVHVEFTPAGETVPWTADITGEDVFANRARGLPTIVLTPPP